MKKLLSVLGYVCLVLGLSLNAQAQNLTTVSAANITDINGAKLASGQLCFLITDQTDTPISVSIGGGGQALRRGYCSPVAAGAVTGFTVPNPANTQPAGIYYRVTVKDSSTGQEVLRYTQVSFTGAAFNFDNYAPQNLGNGAPLSGNSVIGNLSVTGNVAATGTVTASNIPGSIPGAGSCANQFVTALNVAAGPTCSNSLPAYAATNTASSGAAISVDNNTGAGYLDGSGGTIGTGGYVQFTNDASATTGYGTWITNNAFWNGTNWIQPRGTGTSSSGFTANHHKGFSFNRAAASGTNNSSITWTEIANIDSNGNVKAASLNLNGTGILSTTAQSGTGTHCMTTNCSLTTPTIGSAGATFSGSTSGGTVIKASPTASGTLTLPAATDTLVGQSTTDTLTNKTLNHPAITTGVSQGSGFKHQRFTGCTTPTGVNSVCGPFTGTWTTSFSDANYSLSCFPIVTSGQGFALVTSKTASTISYFLINVQSSAATATEFDCIAIHD